MGDGDVPFIDSAAEVQAVEKNRHNSDQANLETGE